MKTSRRVARKHGVDLIVNKDPVRDANTTTDGSCGVARLLVLESAAQKRKQRSAETKALKASILIWNEFNAKSGSIADEFVTL